MKCTILFPLLFVALFAIGRSQSLRAKTTEGKNDTQALNRFMGWYHVLDAYPDLEGWCNSYMSKSSQELVTTRRYFSQQLLNVEYDFVHWGPPMGLNPDWREVITTKKPLWDALLSNGTIVGFFLGDELMGHGLSYDDLVAYSAAMREAFPKAFLWENEGAGTYNDPDKNATHIPAGLSATSVDMYDFTTNAQSNRTAYVEKVRTYYDTIIKPKMWPNQTLFVIPGATMTWTSGKPGPHHPRFIHHCNTTTCQNLVAEDAKLFYEWLEEDPTLGGAMPWMWKGGCRDMPPCRNVWHSLGPKITNKSLSLLL